MPEPIQRPRLAQWMWERGLSPKDAEKPLGCSHMTVRRILLPFGDTGRRVPNDVVLARIVAWTEGAVTAADFYPPHLNGDADKLHLARAE